MMEPHAANPRSTSEPPAAGWTARAVATTPCLPWVRHVLAPADWAAIAAVPPEDETLILIGLWADTQQVHALFLDEATMTAIPVSTEVEAGLYPALSPARPGAALFERAVNDLWGHAAEAGDVRPWLDHGAWMLAKPMVVRPGSARLPYEPSDPTFPDRDPLMQLPLGPVWGRIEEAAHLRLTLRGSDIIAAESQLGFTHKGALALVRGKPPRTAARFAARLSADATVAHSIAFAAAIEAALGVAAPPRAVALRVVMLEIERIAGHLDNLAETGRLVDALAVQTHCAFLREMLLRASATVFGHRLMMDCVIPGGVAIDIPDGGAEITLRALGDLSSQIRAIRRLHDGTALASRLKGIARVAPTWVTLLGVGGVVGRASGRQFDARTRGDSTSPLGPRIVRNEGDAATRQHLRISEIEDSLHLISAALDALPIGPLTVNLPHSSGEGLACTESIRGDVWHWVRLDHGQIAGFFPRDPGWMLWPLAERVLPATAAADVDLIRTSLALPASAMDL
jgi:Ni,Fe-hydrogenase III large subunit